MMTESPGDRSTIAAAARAALRCTGYGDAAVGLLESRRVIHPSPVMPTM